MTIKAGFKINKKNISNEYTSKNILIKQRILISEKILPLSALNTYYITCVYHQRNDNNIVLIYIFIIYNYIFVIWILLNLYALFFF